MSTAPGYSIDPVTLREVLDDVAAAQTWVAHLADLGTDGDPERVAWLRMLGRLDEAEALGRDVLARTGSAAAGIRLGHVLHWQGRFRDADVLFDGSRVEAAGSDALLAFVDQHQGKARFDEGRYAEALTMFEAASARRAAAGVPADQLASSEQALALAKRQLEASELGEGGREGVMEASEDRA